MKKLLLQYFSESEDLILALDRQGAVLDLNASAQNHLDLCAGETRIFSCLANENISAVRTILAESSKRTVLSLQIRLRNQREYIVRGEFFFDSETSRWICSIKNNFSIDEEVNLLRQAGRIAQIGSWHYDIATATMNWSHNLHRLHETDPAKFKPTLESMLSFYGSNDRVRIRSLFQQLSEGLENIKIDVQVNLPSGNKIWMCLMAYPEFVGGQTRRIFGTLQNIDEVVKDRDLLQWDIESSAHLAHLYKMAERRLKMCLQSVSMGTWDWDPATNVILWDDGIYSLYGIERTDNTATISELWQRIIHPDDREKTNREFQLALERQGEVDLVFRIISPKTGKTKHIATRGTLLEDAEGGRRMMGVCWDVTEKRELELISFRNSKMAALGAMASGIAHEINNPISVIHAKAERISEKLTTQQSLSADKLLSDMQLIDSMAMRVAEIIKSMRGLARDESDDNFLPSLVAALFHDVKTICQEKAKARGVVLHFECDALLEVFCHPGQVAQVLINLVTNSIDAVESLQDKWVRVMARQREDLTVEISVTDSGKGIPQKLQEKIMEPFFTTKAPGHGTGLGLSISRQILEKNKGFLSYDPESPNTRFVVTLPSSTVEERAA